MFVKFLNLQKFFICFSSFVLLIIIDNTLTKKNYAFSENLNITIFLALNNARNSPEILALQNSIGNFENIIAGIESDFGLKKVLDVEPFYIQGNKMNIYGKYDDAYFCREDLRRSGFYSRMYLEKNYLNNFSIAAGSGFKKSAVSPIYNSALKISNI